MRTNLLISCAATALLIGIGSANAQGAAEHKAGPGLSKEGPAAAASQPKSAMPAEHGMPEHRSAAEGAKESPKADAASSARPSLNEPKAHQGAANDKASPNTHGAAANEKNAPKAAQTNPADKAAPKSTAAEQPKQKPDRTTAQSEKHPGTSAAEPKTGRSAASGKNEPGKTEPGKTGPSTTSSTTESGRSATSTTTGAGANATTHTGVNAQERGGSAASVQIDPQKQERIRTALSSSKVENVRNVDFSVSIGTRIPERYHFYPLPRDIVEIVPEYRDYEYMVVDNEIVIVNPRTREIVYTMSEGRSAGMNRPSVDCR